MVGGEDRSMSAPIADDFPAIAAGMREDTSVGSEALATAEQFAALKFPALTAPPFSIGTQEEFCAEAAADFDAFFFVEGVLKLDDVGLEKAAARDRDAFMELAKVLADRKERLKMLAKIAQMAQIRLLCVLTRLEEREAGEAD
jgi:hypothetical protein